MSRKDYKKGVEDAVRTNEKFMEKQAEATEELGKRIVQKIDEQGNIIDVILDDLNSNELESVYNIQKEYDIKDLGENEKVVLASFLLTLMSEYGQNTEQQKDYYSYVKQYLEVSDASSDFNLSLVENVDSRNELKAMLQTICEFLFLKTGDDSFMEEFEEEISYFGIREKAVRDIVNQIERIYNILGLRVVVEHYKMGELSEETEEDNSEKGERKKPRNKGEMIGGLIGGLMGDAVSMMQTEEGIESLKRCGGNVEDFFDEILKK